MKKVMLFFAAASSLLTGCIAVPVSDGGVYVTGTARSTDAYPHRHRRDRDGDGVPNRYDRRPHNPYRY